MKTCSSRWALWILLSSIVALSKGGSLKTPPKLAGSPISQARILGGIPIDAIYHFPHHVIIYVITNLGLERYCSGSIISNRWILSSGSCVEGAQELLINFNRQGKTYKRSYSIIIDNSTIKLSSPELENLALIELPMELKFTDKVQPVELFRGNSSAFVNQFAVLPGFSEKNEKFEYGMFRIMRKDECKNLYDDSIPDDFLQICTQGWNNSTQSPTDDNEGGGLLIGWPNLKKVRLIGVFLASFSTDNATGIYMDVSNYIDWIDNTMNPTEVV